MVHCMVRTADRTACVWRGSEVPTARQGVKVLGTPLGHRDFVRTHLEGTTADHRRRFVDISAPSHKSAERDGVALRRWAWLWAFQVGGRWSEETRGLLNALAAFPRRMRWTKTTSCAGLLTVLLFDSWWHFTLFRLKKAKEKRKLEAGGVPKPFSLWSPFSPVHTTAQ